MENKGTPGAAGNAREAATLRTPLENSLIDESPHVGMESWTTDLSPADVLGELAHLSLCLLLPSSLCRLESRLPGILLGATQPIPASFLPPPTLQRTIKEVF